jgi:hypothetical protein
MNARLAVIAAVLGSTLTTAHVAAAQEPQTRQPSDTAGRWSLMMPSGTLLPTGAQRQTIKRGNVSAIQLSYAPSQTFAVTSMFGWARSRDIATDGAPKLDVFTYDIGIEARGPRASAIGFTPFAGAGAGGRSYNYRKLDIDATHNLAAYTSAGADLGVRRVHVRLEARDYVTGFKPLTGQGSARTANDVVVMLGLRIVSR